MSRFSSKVDNRFSYTSAQDSAKPNYLRNRFAAIRKQQAEVKIEVAQKVRKIQGAK